jgi:hypothetical protein
MKATAQQRIGEWDWEMPDRGQDDAELVARLQLFDGWVQRYQKASPGVQSWQWPRRDPGGFQGRVRFVTAQDQTVADTVLGFAMAGGPREEETEAEDVGAALKTLWALVSDQQVSEARRLLNALPSSAPYERARTLLRLPTGRRVKRQNIERTREYKWLSEHRKEHANQWVALSGDILIAAAPTLDVLLARIRELAPPIPPLVHFVD